MENPQANAQPVPPQETRRQVSIALPAIKPVVTYAMLAAIVVVFVAQQVTGQIALEDLPARLQRQYDPVSVSPVTIQGALIYSEVLKGEFYRLFTAMFLHGSIAHLFFNGLALYSFGRNTERFFGHIRFAIIYLLGGLTGSLASLFLTRGVSVGASGAVFAILGAEMIFMYQNRQVFGEFASRELRSLITMGLLNLGLGFYTQFSQDGVKIDNWGHIGGLIGGLILTWFMAPRFTVQGDPNSPTGLYLVDTNPLSKNWVVALGFALAFVAIFAFGFISLRGVR